MLDMTWMNEYEIEDALARTDEAETPLLAKAVRILDRLCAWTNRNSDGWPYWSAPSKAAGKLQDLIASKHPVEMMRANDYSDITEADLKKALTPIKRFLTSRDVEHSLILDDPEPYCNHDEAALVDQGDGTVKCECGAVLRPVTVYTPV